MKDFFLLGFRVVRLTNDNIYCCMIAVLFIRRKALYIEMLTVITIIPELK